VRSARNPHVQRLRRLSRRRSARAEEGAFVVEGETLVAEALDAGVELTEAFVEAGVDPGLVERLSTAGVPVHELADGVLAGAVSTVTPQPIAAIATGADVTLDAALAGPPALVLVLVGVADPGNAGTLLRTAEAAGAGAVLFCAGSVDPYNPKCVRASAGSLFHVKVVNGGEAAAVLETVGEHGVRRVGTVVRDGTPYDGVDLAGPVAVVLGSEAHGLPAGAAELVDVAVTIPMAGRAESLNVAMAGAVLCFESLRQRRTAGSAP
jgi:TrmH family RNA methyltransferase